MNFQWLTQLRSRARRNKTPDISEADKETLRQMDAFFDLLTEQPYEFFVSGRNGEGRCSLSTIWVARILHAQSVGKDESEMKRKEIATLAGRTIGDVNAVFNDLNDAGTFEDSKSTTARVRSYFRKPRNFKSINEAIEMIAKAVCETPELPLSVPGFKLPKGSDINRMNSDKKLDVPTQAAGGASDVT